MTTKAQLQIKFNELKKEHEESQNTGWFNFEVTQQVFGCILQHSMDNDIDLEIGVIPEGEEEQPHHASHVYITFIDGIVARMLAAEKALATLEEAHKDLQKGYDDLDVKLRAVGQ